MLRVVLTVRCVCVACVLRGPSCFQGLAPATQKSSINPKVLRLPHDYTRQLAKLVSCMAGNTHATHSQHDTQHERFSCKFSIKMRVVCKIRCLYLKTGFSVNSSKRAF